MNYTNKYTISLDKTTELYFRRADLLEMIKELEEGYPSQQSPISKASYTRTINRYKKELEEILPELAKGPPIKGLDPKKVTEGMLAEIQNTEARFHSRIKEFHTNISKKKYQDVFEEIRWHLAEAAAYQGMLDAMQNCGLTRIEERTEPITFQKLQDFLFRASQNLLVDVLRHRSGNTSNPIQNVISSRHLDGQRDFYRLYLSQWVLRIENSYDQVITWHKLRNMTDWVPAEHYEKPEEEISP